MAFSGNRRVADLGEASWRVQAWQSMMAPGRKQHRRSLTSTRCTSPCRSRRHVGALQPPVLTLQDHAVSDRRPRHDTTRHDTTRSLCPLPSSLRPARRSTSARAGLEHVAPSQPQPQPHAAASMAETPSKQWGVTAPISSSPPTAKDLKLNDELIEELKRQNVFESPEGSDMRYGHAACIGRVS